MQKLKVPLLWAIFTAVAFFSCGNVSSPSEEDDHRVIDFQFLKGKYYVDEKYPILGEVYAIDECTIGDSVILRCLSIPVGSSLIAKITSYKTKNVIHISFLEQGGLTYTANYPLPPMFYLCRFCVSDVGGKSNVLKVSPDGDMLIVEILNSNPQIIKSLNIKNK